MRSGEIPRSCESPVPGSAPTCGSAQQGYSLVVLIVAITLLSLGMAAALPFWSSRARSEDEAEAVFRGLQYAEAVRVFKLRHGRYPTQLEELLELEPRSIRQLWKDPITDGEFGLLVEIAAPREAGGRRRPRAAGADSAEDSDESDDDDGDESEGQGEDGSGRVQIVRLPPVEGGRTVRSAGAIRGVYVESDETPRRNYFEAGTYRDWLFTDQLIELPPVPDGESILKRARSDWIGLGFSEIMQPNGIGEAPTAGEMPGSDRERDRREPDSDDGSDEDEDLDTFDDLE